MRRWLAIASVLACASNALADDKTTADVLFEEAQKLISAGRYSEACPKLAESQRLDPGIGTALYLGDCYEKVGRTASAWGSFREALSLAERAGDKRAAVAKRRADALEPILSRLTIKLDPGISPSSVHIERNDKRVAPIEIGLAIPVDPGDVTITAQAEGHERWETTVKVPEKNGAIEVVVKLGPAIATPPPATVTPPPVTVTPTAKSAPPPPGDRSSSLTPLRIAGIGVGVVGLAAIGIGAGLAVSAKGTFDSAKQMGRCDMSDFCTPEGLELRAGARSTADVATVMFIAGGVLAAAGVTLFIVAPKKKSAALLPIVAPGWAGLSLSLQ
jgi:hypothetical protein